MTWKKLGDIQPLYNHVTIVAGDIQVMGDWPGAEKAGYPDDEYDLASGTVMVFDLSLLRATVFTDGASFRLLASPDGKGTENVDEATLASAVEAPGSAQVWGSFEVEHGALVLTSADCATPHEGATTDAPPELPRIPRAIPSEPTRLGQTMIVSPCENGRYEVSTVAKVNAKHRTFDTLALITIRRA